jgi:hypothetical protein
MPRAEVARISDCPGHVDIERDELETGAVRMRISDPGAVINGFSEAVKSYKRHINIGQIITDQYHAAH